MIAPPTIAMQRIPDAWPVCLPSPLIESVKIVGNIIELKSPTEMIAHIEILPVVKIVVIINTITAAAWTVNTFAGEMYRTITDPINRPTIAAPQ